MSAFRRRLRFRSNPFGRCGNMVPYPFFQRINRIEKIKNKENIDILYSTLVTGLVGDNKLEKIKLSKEYNGSKELELNGLFVEIGSEPNNLLPNKLCVETDKQGYIVVNGQQKTNIDCVWAAGDCTTNSNKLKQVVTACAEGAVASNSIQEYLKN